MSQIPNDPHRPQQPNQPPSNPYGQDVPGAGAPVGDVGGHAGQYPGPYADQERRPTGNAVESRGFFASLFDFSFTSFVTIKFARIIYIVLLVFIALGWLFWIVAGFADSAVAGMLFLLLGWIPGLITLVLARVTMEFYIAMVRTSQNTAATRAELESLRADGRR
jgi:hypothetical protein